MIVHNKYFSIEETNVMFVSKNSPAFKRRAIMVGKKFIQYKHQSGMIFLCRNI